MALKVLIFDFDGTIADSRITLVKIANELADEFGYDPVTESDIVRLSNLSSKDVIIQSPIPAYKIPFLLRRVKRQLNEHIAYLQPFEGMEEALSNLKKKGCYLGIITSNLGANVSLFLRKNSLDNYFDFVYSANTLFGKNKVINKAIDKHHLLKDEVIYIGDETRDIEAAKKSNIKVAAVTWGFNSASVLKKYNPDFILDKPQELLDIIKCNCGLNKSLQT
ncbi:HAD-IA family hydrolase [Cyanobacterium aponinum UTEX 3222]|uniref:HAD-IA family hydrolase n=1 Tax=Cyanobacterium aponinum TaxID=379064 RepID=UPI000C12C939|nr:HAD-IA family hydrolase [Cyanobacterium aponinum]PHV61186.1 carotenoid oxygenase [Cyanobacterium aponinum IPPAS B-1201]WRL44043.1 HAD-IA family hydrolase [Cyanobacterium aponinum UTEX 3222]